MTNELYHHGILGQKWGVRRYQNLDGTLTPAGKKRRGKKDSGKDKKKFNKTKALVIGASIVAAGLAAYGGYKVYSEISFDKMVKDLVEKSADKYAKTKVENYVRAQKMNFGKTLSSDTRDAIYRSFYPDEKKMNSEVSSLKKAYKQAKKDYRSNQRNKQKWMLDFDKSYNPLTTYRYTDEIF